MDIHQKLSEKYKPKLVRYVRLSQLIRETHDFEEVFDALKNAPKQKQLLMGIFNQNPKGDHWKQSKDLLDQTNSTTAVLRTLISKGLLEEQFFREDRLLYDFKNKKKSVLSDGQNKSLNEINNAFKDKAVVLFQGVTGSGKTEVYIELISQAVGIGKQVLYLLPEISLTPQIVKVTDVFGNEVTVYHSKFSVNERTEIWNNVIEKSPKAKIIIGTRSALFLPFQNLSLLIVDEEHELSYKQFDPSPRYHARDSAVILARIHKAKVLLGSATPSLESSFNQDLENMAWVPTSRKVW